MSYLLDVQLAELVGSTRTSSQIEWLNRNGWMYALRRDGRPRVAQAEHDRHMIGGKQTQLKEIPQWEPRA